MYEIGLVIIWPNYLDKYNEILSDISNKFDVVNIFNIQWSSDLIYTNFYRFYGDRLSTRSIKEKALGSDIFNLIVFKDNYPLHDFRTNARGVEKVNINLFDFKKFLRNKYNTKFGIHGSNSEVETDRDLSLLLGINLLDFKKNIEPNTEEIKITRDVTGTNNWESFNELFYLINSVNPYVILRNADEIFELSDGDDIDFLVDNPTKFAYFINAKKMSNGTQRANYEIIVNNKKIRVDLRYIGDCYFDPCWQRNALYNRVLNSDNIYVLDDVNHYYSLIYHSLIHKRKFPKKYLNYFNLTIDELQSKLYDFMIKNNYQMVEPRDITLNFNRKYGGDIKFSRERRLRYKKGLSGKIKRLAHKINNLIHFRKGLS
jgi:hypothetical protein